MAGQTSLTASKSILVQQPESNTKVSTMASTRPSPARRSHHQHCKRGGARRLARDSEDRCESFPFDELKSIGEATTTSRDHNAIADSDSDDSSILLQRPGCRPSGNSGRVGKRFLDAFACLCIGSNDANDYIDETEQHFLTTATTKPKLTSVSPRDVTKLIQPRAFAADQESGALYERPHRSRRNASFPESRFVFRPVSDEDTTTTGFESALSRGWEV
jgi:hypothetical protein